MNTNTMELSLEEMEQVNGGSSLDDFFKKAIIWHVIHYLGERDNSKGGCDLVHVA